LKRAGIPVPGLQARDGLAVINGCNVMTAMAALWLCDAYKVLRTAEIAACMSLEALNANLGPFDDRIHTVRGFHGSIESAKSLRAILKGGSLMNKEKKVRTQDAYSLRSTPQIIGAAHDAFGYARTQVEIELNGVGDNPVFSKQHASRSRVRTSRVLQSQCPWTCAATLSRWSACFRSVA